MVGESMLFRFDTGLSSDRGCMRDHNEDSALALENAGIWAVADGMGGHEAGDVASRIVVEELGSVGMAVSAHDLGARVAQRLERAHQRILTESDQRGGTTMGATVAVLSIFEEGCGCTWAGDSRIYLLRANRVRRLTSDHSEVQGMIDAGTLTEDEARHSPRRNVITRAIGITAVDGPETVTGMVEAGDTFLICSDGLTEHIDDAELPGLLNVGDAQAMSDRLIAVTLDRGARDNVTAVVVRCLPPAADPGGQA
ncbi:PP2C family protein-serine/threonine phosphatase [Paracoccus pacificus]|uniref:PP2C family protein-serine/threonine phosphatase n=1 Tax=Paracoccus pacificus TaxID=1463598 RepID=A0ABW4R706_9RHOB